MLIRWVTIALITMSAMSAQPPHRHKATGSANRAVQPKAKPKPFFDLAAIANPGQPDASPGDQNSAVLRAQILLDRAHFSCGEIDGEFGTNLEKVLAAYQADRHLPPSGKIDGPTWGALNGDT